MVLNFANEYGTTDPAGWKNIYGTNANISTAGNVSFSGIAPHVGTGGNISFVNSVGFTGYYNPRSTGSNTGVFPDGIIGFGWQFTNGATFTIGGLTSGQSYTFYILSNANPWEASTVSFTVGGVTSNTTNDSDNFGSSATSPWYNDASLNKVTFTASGTTATVTCNVVSGNSIASINALVVTK